MKKLLSIAIVTIIVSFIANDSNAQQSTTASTNVKIVLTDFITAENAAQSSAGTVPGSASVEFNYPDAASYKADKTMTVAGHLKLTATKGFEVKVKAAGTDFENGSNKIPVSVLDITPTVPGDGGTASNVTLSNADQTILSGAKSGMKTIDVTYKIPASKAQLHILGKPQGTYQQTVIYTFSLQ